jgi:hypothetical protein
MSDIVLLSPSRKLTNHKLYKSRQLLQKSLHNTRSPPLVSVQIKHTKSSRGFSQESPLSRTIKSEHLLLTVIKNDTIE